MKIDNLIEEVKKYFKVYVSEFITDTNTLEDLQENKKSIRCLFPDHDDKNPSMMLNETNAYCFKCGSMNIFKAANVFEGKPLSGKEFINENLLYLAKKFGVNPEIYGFETTEEDLEVIDIRNFFTMMETYLRFFVDTEHTTKLLNKRKISKELAFSMGIGSIKDYNHFEKYAAKHGFKLIEYEKYGITKQNLGGYKIIFIIKDNYGNPCSFASREMRYDEKIARKILTKFLSEEIVSETSKKGLADLTLNVADKLTKEEQNFVYNSAIIPKYNNGLTSPAYKKNEIIYGYNVIRKKMTKFSPVIAVEGYMDSISAMQNKQFNIGSYNSANLSKEQFTALKKLNCSYIVFLPDNDSTGRKKIEQLVKSKNIDFANLRIGFFKDKTLKDVDDFFKKYPDENLLHHIDILTIPEVHTKLLIDEGKDIKTIISEVGEKIASIKPPIERREVASNLFYALEKNNLTDEVWNKRTILEQIEYLHKYDKDTLAKKMKNHFYECIREIDENPYDIIPMTRNLLKKISEKEDIRNTRKTLWEIRKDKFKQYQLKKREQKDPYIYGFDFLDRVRITEPSNIVVLGKSNTGKTVSMINWAIGALKNDENSTVVYFSTDDVYNRVVDNFVACYGDLFKSFVNEPYTHPKYGINIQSLNKAKKLNNLYNLALKQIEDWIDSKRLCVIGLDDNLAKLSDLENFIDEHYNSSTVIQNSKRTIFLDSSSKVIVDGPDSKPIATISRTIKGLCARYGYNVFQNYEVTKAGLRSNYRVDKGDLSDGKEIEFDADLIIRVTQPFHDLSEGGRSIAKSIWENKNKLIMPIVVIDYQKNKLSEEKMKAYYLKLHGDKAKIEEITKEDEGYDTIRKNFNSDLRAYSSAYSKNRT